MATIWITYAWADNENKDVDFVAQELIREGLQVKLDRWNLQAGKPLWEQIGEHITDPANCDAWAIFATHNSLASPACKEELAYALDRALNKRGERFPVIALFPSRVDQALIPPAIRVRLHVSLTDPDWKERTVAACENRSLRQATEAIEPYVFKIHLADQNAKSLRGYNHVIEVRPRAGVWSPFFVAIPEDELSKVGFDVNVGATDRVPGLPEVKFNFRRGQQGPLYIESRLEEATPTRSIYVYCKEFPSVLHFGTLGAPPQYQAAITRTQ